MGLIILLITYVFTHVMTQLWPRVYKIVLSMNGSQQRRLHFVAEYFVDQEKYYYLLLLHMFICYYMILFVLLVTGMSLYTYLQYACGMFKIASYRFESTMKIYVSQNIMQRNENLLHKGIVRAIDIQRNAMMICEYLMSTFEVMFMYLIGLGVMLLTLNIFRAFQIISSGYKIEELGMCYLSSLSCLIYMFLSNFVGQEVTDHYNYVFDTIYNIQWYLAPLHIQKLTVFLMQRGNKSFGLNVAGLFVASLQCFAMLANSSVSYFLVLYSIR
ncbi:PREDICTED: uncharacterized protein LOC105568172 [Vollenhovia emeryi]|uniref:uncharacterized protein LOC105568172 n=1 Tax=Vollenhovia emeryi TaxID=411798 RepID=UPI0005F3ADEF|nr:PREDICTED: uncharacterized protein LOC105568172 [Vollenhovia emeryi]